MKYIKPILSIFVIIVCAVKLVMLIPMATIYWYDILIGGFWWFFAAAAGILGLISSVTQKLTGAALIISIIAALRMIFEAVSCLVYGVSLSLVLFEILVAIPLVLFLILSLERAA